MEATRHTKHNYRISRHTGKRLPSKHTIRQKIEKHQKAIDVLRLLLSEHTEVV